MGDLPNRFPEIKEKNNNGKEHFCDWIRYFLESYRLLFQSFSKGGLYFEVSLSNCILFFGNSYFSKYRRDTLGFYQTLLWSFSWENN